MLLDFRKSPACTRRLIQIADLVRASTGSRSGEVGQRADERWRSGVTKAVVKVSGGKRRRKIRNGTFTSSGESKMRVRVRDRKEAASNDTRSIWLKTVGNFRCALQLVSELTNESKKKFAK